MLHTDIKYLLLLSPQLKNFIKKSDVLYNFRCTICGDSQSNEHKSRGYVFTHKGILIYKCHNCGSSMSFETYLKSENDSLYSQYKLEKYADKYSAHKPQKDESFSGQKPKFNDVSTTEKLFSSICKPVNTLSDKHPANVFLQKRQIVATHDLFFVEDGKMLEKLNPRLYKDRLYKDSGRIVIPYRNERKEITSITARDLKLKSSLRYINIKLDEDSPMIWGLDQVNKRNLIIVTEGAFDAMFLDNAVAASGSDLIKVHEMFFLYDVVFIFDNEPRNSINCKKMKDLIEKGHKVFVPDSSLKGTDINEMILNGHSKNELMGFINNVPDSKLIQLMNFNKWAKIATN